MDQDADDAMEIDDTVPNSSQIIERSVESPKNPPPDAKTSNSSDVVVLDDEDEASSKQAPNPPAKPISDLIDLVEKPKSTRCLNSNCKCTNFDFIPAPDFCLAYFRVKRSKLNKEEVCQECYTQAVASYDQLSSELQDGNLLFAVDYPVVNETLQIEDSDEEMEEDEDAVDYISAENFEFIRDNIDEVLEKTLMKFDIDKQLDLEKDYVKTTFDSVHKKVEDLSSETNVLRNLLDTMQIDLYNLLHPTLKTQPSIAIVDDGDFSIKLEASNMPIANPTTMAETRKSKRAHKPVSYVDLDDPGNSNSPKVALGSSEYTEPKDMPPEGPTEKKHLKIGELYYIARENNTGPWIRARLMQFLSMNGRCKLVELKQQKDRVMDRKSMAYVTPCHFRLKTGTRVIAALKLPNEEKRGKNDPYYVGVVAETPTQSNKFRYLIFFDIGHASYVQHSQVNLVVDASPRVWEDMATESNKEFIRKYLESQDRPMVRLSKNETVRTEYNRKWWNCTVIDVDCSLMLVQFDGLNRVEWLYRGSPRLNPVFKEDQAASNRQPGMRSTRKIGASDNKNVVQYICNKDAIGTPTLTPKPGLVQSSDSVRAVARKSTTRPQSNLTSNVIPFLPELSQSSGPTSKIMYFTPRDQAITGRVYTSHECSPQCKVYLTHMLSKLRGHNPLSKPLLCGWARLTSKTKGKKEITYKTPCGRMLKNIAEVHTYLRLTKSEMTVDLFDFNHMVRCLAEFSVDCLPDPKDLSNGVEQVSIPVINGFNNVVLDFCNYSIKRVPMDGVHLNLDPEFLCGCDCEDDCTDKTKCSCWKLTLESLPYMGKDVNPNSIGYIYRRLPEQVITGIYECNSRCKCASTCLNRVVQNPMSLKLQVFRTHNRGWGIRCLNDVPQGSFICIYAGTIHTEQMANSDGVTYGDEYFAELDYIEAVERYKEDYEQDVLEDENYRSSRKSSPNSGDEEEKHAEKLPSKKRQFVDNDFVPASQIATNSNATIKTRLRTRTGDEEKEESSNKSVDNLTKNIDTVTISDEEDEGREVLSFNPKGTDLEESQESKYTSVRDLFGKDENVYVMDAKNVGNIGRFLNHSCSPNVFVQNVFVDSQDLRFPWVAFFSSQFIRAGTELTWNYNYDIGSVPGRVMYCHCAALECKGRLL